MGLLCRTIANAAQDTFSTNTNYTNTAMAKYHTEGIVKDVTLTQTDGTFTLEASAPFAVDEQSSGLKEKSILFVSEEDDPTKDVFNQEERKGGEVGSPAVSTVSTCLLRDAFLASNTTKFKFGCVGKPIEMAALLLLKQNRTKIRVVIDGDRKPTTTTPTTSGFIVSEIVIK